MLEKDNRVYSCLWKKCTTFYFSQSRKYRLRFWLDPDNITCLNWFELPMVFCSLQIKFKKVCEKQLFTKLKSEYRIVANLTVSIEAGENAPKQPFKDTCLNLIVQLFDLVIQQLYANGQNNGRWWRLILAWFPRAERKALSKVQGAQSPWFDFI